MNRLDETLARTRAEGRAALIAYLPVGFPSVEGSLAAMRALVEAGADIVEVGIPYSDPVLDGPTIQRAAAHALAGGVRVRDALRAVEVVATAGAVPVVMSYYNLIRQYGVASFAADLASAGGAGIITPDLIPDEAQEWLAAAAEHDLDPVFLIAPSSTQERMAMTVAACRGFVYVASIMGVTGARTAVSGGARELVARARALTDLPLCVGLGVSTRAQAAELAGYADGVIVGSALVNALATDSGTTPGSSSELTGPLANLRAIVTELSQGVREGRSL